MTDVTGRRWALVVFGTPALLLAVVGVVGAGLFVVPGAPCGATADLAPPSADVAVTANGSTVTAVVTGDRPLGGETTDRMAVVVRDAESGRTTTLTWADGGRTLDPGATVTVTNATAGFPITPPDTVSVRWFGADPGVADFCPNGRTFADLTRVRVENASMLVGT